MNGFLSRSVKNDFHKEVCILHRLAECPNIVCLLGLCLDPDYCSIIMEFVENGNLEDLLLGDLTSHPIIEQWECRIRMALDVATGMNFLHKLEPPIIHRDLKTANVLVDIRYCCKVGSRILVTSENCFFQE
jgi:serine/threonine protein kinase